MKELKEKDVILSSQLTDEEKRTMVLIDRLTDEEKKKIEDDLLDSDKPFYTLEEIFEIAKRENLHKNRR